jgi:hypothetical protein
LNHKRKSILVEESSFIPVIGLDIASYDYCPDAQEYSNEIICQHKYPEPGNDAEPD